MLGKGSPLHRELGTVVAAEGWDQPNVARVLYAGLIDALQGDAARAEVAFRDVMATAPGTQTVLQLALGFALYRQGEFAGALEAFQQAEPHVGGDNESFDQTFHSLALCGEAFALLRLGRTDAAAGVLARAPVPNSSADLAWRLPQALALRALGDAFNAQEQNDSAMQAWSRVAELARPDDPAELTNLRRVAIVPRVPDIHTDANERLTQRWTHMLIAMIADGGAAQIKRLLVDANATESLEPLWLAARAELGEDLGPLPAEVLDAVEEVRRMIAEERS